MDSQSAGSQQRSNVTDSSKLLQGTGATAQLLQGTSTVTMPGPAAQVEKGSGGPPGGTTRLLDDSTALAFAASVLEPEPASGMGPVLEPDPAGGLGSQSISPAWLESHMQQGQGPGPGSHAQHQSWLPGARFDITTRMAFVAGWSQPNVALDWCL